MEEIRFYFSPDGAQSFGPVTIPALRRLVHDQILTEGSYLRAEDRPEWQPIEIEFFLTPEPAEEAALEAVSAPPEPLETETAEQEIEPPESAEPEPVIAESVAEIPVEAPPPITHAIPVFQIPKRRGKAPRARPPDEEPDLFSSQAEAPAPSEPELFSQFSTPATEAAPAPRMPRARRMAAVSPPTPEVSVAVPPAESAPAAPRPPSVPAPLVSSPSAFMPPVAEAETPPIISVPHYYAPPVRAAVAPVSPAIKVKEASPPPAPEPAATTEEKENNIVAASAVILGLAVATGLAWLAVTTVTWLDATAPAGVPTRAYQLGVFVGLLTSVLVLPRLISYLFRGRRRSAAFACGVGIMSALAVAGDYWEVHQAARLKATATQNPEVNPAAKLPPLQIRTQDDDAQNPEDAAQKIQAFKDQIGPGTTQSARVSRDLLTIVSELLVRTKRCDELSKTCNFDVNTLTGPDDITGREAAIAQLNDAQEDVVKYLQHVNDRCHVLLQKDKMSEADINQTIGTFRGTGHVDLLLELWEAQTKLSADQIARLEFLARSRGTWTIDSGRINFPDDKALANYNAFVHDLQGDVQTITGIQEQLHK